MSDRRNLIYYPQFSKEADTYQINKSALIPSQSLPSCSTSQNMLIAIVSKPSEIDRREAIRISWANNTFVNTTFTKVVFIVGKTESEKIARESAQYQDIIITEIFESYYNLSLKTFAVFDFAYKKCFHAECVIKADSDNILNIAAFEELCRNHTAVAQKSSLGYIGGSCNVNLNIHREYRHKWHIPHYVYPEEKFPTYCSSGTYAYYGQNSWQTTYHSVFRSQFFYSSNMRHLPEDIIFTGILATYNKIPRIDMQGFSFIDQTKVFCSKNKTLAYSIHLNNIRKAREDKEAIISFTLEFFNFLNHSCSSPIN